MKSNSTVEGTSEFLGDGSRGRFTSGPRSPPWLAQLPERYGERPDGSVAAEADIGKIASLLTRTPIRYDRRERSHLHPSDFISFQPMLPRAHPVSVQAWCGACPM